MTTFAAIRNADGMIILNTIRADLTSTKRATIELMRAKSIPDGMGEFAINEMFDDVARAYGISIKTVKITVPDND